MIDLARIRRHAAGVAASMFRDRCDREDCAQEMVLSAILAQRADPSASWAFISSVIVNRGIDVQQKARCRSRNLPLDLSDWATNKAIHDGGLRESEGRMVAEAMIAAAPSHTRRALSLMVAGYGKAETAAMVGRHRSSVIRGQNRVYAAWKDAGLVAA